MTRGQKGIIIIYIEQAPGLQFAVILITAQIHTDTRVQSQIQIPLDRDAHVMNTWATSCIISIRTRIRLPSPRTAKLFSITLKHVFIH